MKEILAALASLIPVLDKHRFGSVIGVVVLGMVVAFTYFVRH